MEEAIAILDEVGREFEVSAELRQLIRHSRLVERLTREGSGMGTVLAWMESAADDLSALANVFNPSSQTAAHFRARADCMRAYSNRLRAVGVVPTNPKASYGPPGAGSPE
jgi:hypothetical protein